MAQIGAVFVFCSSCKILYFASSVHPKNATALFSWVNMVLRPFVNEIRITLVHF